MKRLTKKSLDELARTMNVIPDVENYRGGDYFYNSLGQLISTTKDGDEVWINSDKFSDSTNTTAQIAIIRHITGYQGNIVANPNLAPKDRPPGSSPMAAEGGILYYQPGHYFLDNYYNMKNLYVHETVHFAGNKSDCDAWAAAKADSTWNNTTWHYKENTKVQLAGCN